MLPTAYAFGQEKEYSTRFRGKTVLGDGVMALDDLPPDRFTPRDPPPAAP